MSAFDDLEAQAAQAAQPEAAEIGGVPSVQGSIIATIQQAIEQTAVYRAAAAVGAGAMNPYAAAFAASRGTGDDSDIDPPDTIDRVRTWMRELSSSDPRRLIEVQQRLFAIGMYPNGTEPTWGYIGPADQQAFRNFASRAQDATEYVPGNPNPQPMSLSQLLMDDANSLADPELADVALSLDPISVVLQNPESLVALIDATYAREGLGRPSPEARRAFVAAFHAMQRGTAEAEMRARMQMEDDSLDGEDIVEQVGAPDPATFTRNFIREQEGAAVFDVQDTIGIANTIRGNLGRA